MYEAFLDPAETARLAIPGASLREPAETASRSEDCRLTLRLVDATNGQPVAGLVRCTAEDGSIGSLPGLLNRGTKLRGEHPGKRWYALIETAETSLPARRWKIEVIAGLDSERTVQTIDLTGRHSLEIVIPIRRFMKPFDSTWKAGNTHLHLEGLSRAQADDYLRTIPRADGLDLLFVSYLSRIGEDQGYISNAYTAESMHAFDRPGLLYGWGEEHRHNFPGDGYGHVMLLNLHRLIQPVSIGSMLMGDTPDYPPLRHGIDEAKRQGATILWCHNANGTEDLPNLFSGRIDAVNIFDSGPSGDFSISYYRYLNVGLTVPFSTGTDWFIHSFSRVYAQVEGPVTRESWLAALRAGRTFITNGTLLDLRADGHKIGDNVNLTAPASVSFHGQAIGRNDFGGIDLVRNGVVVAHAATQPEQGHFVARIDIPITIDRAAWVALRVSGGSLDTASGAVFPESLPIYGTPKGTNEMGSPLYGHTSPIYFNYQGQRVFVAGSAQALLEELDQSRTKIAKLGRFDTADQRETVFQLYNEATEWLQQKIAHAR